jgi:uncharacterized protein (TIGR03435 family)
MRNFFAALILICSALFGQSAKPAFDAVSVRPGSMKPVTLPSGMSVVGAMQGGPGTDDPTYFRGNSVSLANVIQRAFGMKPNQLSAPDWINMARYDITAKVPPGTTAADFAVMLQTMLEERFEMKAHRETKEVQGYNLVIAKNGLKLREVVTTDICSVGGHPVGQTCPTGGPGPQNGIALSKANGRTSLITGPKDGGRTAMGTSVTTAMLTNMLEGTLRPAPVADKTGLPDKYDLRFEFSLPDVGSQGDFALPTVFAALENELGLKLDPVKVPVEMVVIDHIAQPSQN